MNLDTLFATLSPPDLLALLAIVAFKGALIFLLAALVTGLMRRASAAARHAVWTLALAAALILPALFALVPSWQVPVLPGAAEEAFVTSAGAAVPLAPSAPSAPAAPAFPLPDAAPAPPPDIHLHVFEDGSGYAFVQDDPMPEAKAELAVAVQRAKAAVLHTLPPTLRHGEVWVLLIWLVGAATLALRWLFAVAGAWWLVRDAEPVHDPAWLDLKERLAYGMELDREVRLLRSDRLGVPVAGGTFDPVVVLPADADTWPEERREVVLTHELAHIVRGDCLTQTVAQWALALHWFNPLAWLAHRRYLLEREHACDDWVLNHGTRASDYAEHLLQIARRFRRETLVLHATAPMARKSNLESRITSILNPERRRSAFSRAALVAMSLVALALVLPLAAFHPVEKEAELRDVQFTAFSLAPAKVFGERLPKTVYHVVGDETFEWEGRVPSGGFVEVRGINGAIRARTGSGDRLRIEARKTAKRSDESRVEIVVREFANGVVVCAVYPGQRDDCAPGTGPGGDTKNNDVTVAFDVVLPETVRFVGHTVNGDITTTTLGRDIEAHTVNGSIRAASHGGDIDALTVNGGIQAEATGLVRAKTVNGSITARLGRTDWSGEMAFNTVNGSITLDLPASANTTVEARAQTGSIHSDFPLAIKRTGYVGAEAEGTLGSGGRHLELSVLNGSIRLQRASGAFGSRVLPRFQDREETAQNEARLERLERRAEKEARRMEARHREIEERARRLEHASHDLVGEALASIGPVMELAMAEAGQALAEIDLEHEVESALAEVDWDEIEYEMEAAFEEAEREMELAEEEMERWEVEWEEACDEEHDHEHDGR